VQPLIDVGEYLSLVSRTVLAFGIMFELPVLAFFLARVGLIDHRFLIRHLRYAVVISAVFSAVLTPPDLVSQVLFMLPLSLLYAIAIAVAYVAARRTPSTDAD
jgi:sec-independent protein translocase protein TatC